MKDIPTIYPMKAKAIDDVEPLWDDDSYVAERKYDGCRYLLYITGDGPNRLFSRRPSDKKDDGSTVEKTDNVPHLRDMKFDVCGLTVLDGEIITHENCKSNEVTTIMGASPETAVERQVAEGFVQFVIFDILYLDGNNFMGLYWQDRRKILLEFRDRVLRDNPSYFSDIHISKVVTENKKEFYESIVAGGGEGVVLKNIYATYQPDKRPSNTWVKVKKYETFDVVITGFDPPERVYKGKNLKNWPYWAENPGAPSTPVTKFYAKGWIGAVRFGQYLDGELVEIGCTSGMDEATRLRMTIRQQYLVGTVIEVGAMERIKKTNALRHPRFLRFRPDKDASECIIGEC